MESLFIYLAKVSGLITLFSIVYYLFLKKETFFTSIRFFLIAGIITSFILPLITISKIVWITPVPLQEISTTNTGNVQILSNNSVVAEVFQINWSYIAVSIYVLGVAFFLMRLITDLYKVSALLKKQNTQQDGKFRLIDSVNNTLPFSFFRYIVFNSASLTPEELNDIIAHEKVHSRQLHSIDMILSQIACIVLWFNPASWLYKKQVAHNLEFIADAEATKNISDIKSYQKTLLKITLEPQCIAITNHFYQSLIRKRIMMLNKKQSGTRNIIRFAFIIPALAAFIYLFQTEVIAKESDLNNRLPQTRVNQQTVQALPAAVGSEIKYPTMAITYIDKAFTDAAMKDRAAMYKDIFETDVQFKNVRRNKKGEITAISVIVKDKHHIQNYPVYESISDNGAPIETFMLNIERDTKDSENKITFQKVENSASAETSAKTTEKETVKSEILTPVEYINSRMKDSDVIVVINNEIQTSKYITEPLGEKFESIIELDEKTTLKLFKVKAKGGAIVLTTKKIANPISAYNPSISKTSISTKVYEAVNADVNNNTNSRTNSSVIRTITTMSDSDGKVIENYTADTNYYIISKNSTNVQLNTFKEDLKIAGLKIEYSDIVRNSRGVITAINIKLEDKSNSAKASASWESDRNSNGVPNIYIGKIKGRLIVSSSQL